MPSRKRVQDTHFSAQFSALRGALLTLGGLMNRPQMDAALVKAAGISLDSALFPLLARVERLGPIGVVELADHTGRDYTTVSRQVAKLESLGLVSRRTAAHDNRVREAVVTPKGKSMTDALDAAREQMGWETFSQWDPQDFAELVRLVCKLAQDLEGRAAVIPPAG